MKTQWDKDRQRNLRKIESHLQKWRRSSRRNRGASSDTRSGAAGGPPPSGGEVLKERVGDALADWGRRNSRPTQPFTDGLERNHDEH